MAKNIRRTDLALEARELSLGDGKDVEGVKYHKEDKSGCIIHFLEVIDDTGAKNIGKPIGKYCTIEIDGLVRRESDSFAGTATAIAAEISDIMPETNGGCILIAGLGNRGITPDSIGPVAADNILVTKHLKERMPQDFAAFSPTVVVRPGVLGTSGIESSEYIKSICSGLSPAIVIAVDALAARSLDRLCRTVQITDTGITPGSGVGNSRSAVNSDVLGIPVVAIGVPTVVDIATVLADMNAPQSGGQPADMIVTPRAIDSEAAGAGRLVGYAINLALHKGLTIEDVDMLLG